MKLSRMFYSWPQAYFLRTPFTCNIKITTRCNLRCGFCGLWSYPVTQELKLTDYRHIADVLNSLGIARVVITGGEPLLRDDAPDILNLFSKHGISTTLLTNGTLLTREILQRFIDCGLNDIGISLDSLVPDRIDTICRSSNIWQKIVDAISLSVEMLQGGVVEVLTTVSRENLMEVPDIVRFVNSSLGAWALVNPVNVPHSDKSILSANVEEWAPPYPAEEVDAVYDELEKMKRDNFRILVSKAFLKVSRHYLKTGEFNWSCDAGERYFTVFPNGGLAPCSDQSIIRNIMQMTSSDFRSKQYKQEVRKVQNECRGCIYACWREASFLFTNASAMTERVKSLRRIHKGR